MKPIVMTKAEFDEESEAFASFVKDQAALVDAINSLGGRESNGLMDKFIFYSASHVNRAADGFILLRNADRLDSARLLIRPAIESMIRMMAVHKQPDLLFRIAYSERLEDIKWHKPVFKRLGKPFDAQAEATNWNTFKASYVSAFPAHSIVEEKLSLFEAAEKAGPEAVAFYDTHFRLFCKCTHAAFSATSGSLDHLISADTRTISICTKYALAIIQEILNRPA